MLVFSLLNTETCLEYFDVVSHLSNSLGKLRILPQILINLWTIGLLRVNCPLTFQIIFLMICNDILTSFISSKLWSISFDLWLDNSQLGVDVDSLIGILVDVDILIRLLVDIDFLITILVDVDILIRILVDVDILIRFLVDMVRSVDLMSRVDVDSRVVVIWLARFRTFTWGKFLTGNKFVPLTLLNDFISNFVLSLSCSCIWRDLVVSLFFRHLKCLYIRWKGFLLGAIEQSSMVWVCVLLRFKLFDLLAERVNLNVLLKNICLLNRRLKRRLTFAEALHVLVIRIVHIFRSWLRQLLGRYLSSCFRREI